MSDQNRNDGLENLGGDARAAARDPMSADPGVRDASATGGSAPLSQGGGSEGGVATAHTGGGGAGSPGAGATYGDSRQGGDPAAQSAADLHGGSVTLDQGPKPNLEADADRLQARWNDDRDQASELGRLGPGGSGVGNTVAPQPRGPGGER